MKVKFFLISIFCLSFFTSQAQQDSVTITDDELERYAVMIDSLESMRTRILNEISDMVKNSEGITVSRYNELSKIATDDAKLAAAKATPEEINVVKTIQAKKDAGTATINETFKTLAKEYVGAASYNKIRKAIESNASVKARYQTMLDKVKEGS